MNGARTGLRRISSQGVVLAREKKTKLGSNTPKKKSEVIQQCDKTDSSEVNSLQSVLKCNVKP